MMNQYKLPTVRFLRFELNHDQDQIPYEIMFAKNQISMY